MHDRIADRGHLDDPLARDPGRLGDAADETVDGLADDGGHLAVAAGMEHHVGDPAHQVLAEADLRVHHARRSQHLAAGEVAKMRGNRGRADVDGDAERLLDQARPDRDEIATAHGNRDLPAAGAQGLLQRGEDRHPGPQPLDPPLLAERHREAVEVACRIVHVRLGHFDIVERHRRIGGDRAGIGRLADDLPMDLAFRRHVDHHIAGDVRLASEPPPGLQLAAQADIALLRRVPGAEMTRRGRDAVFRELAFGNLDLAASADAPPAADRIEIGAERAGRIEHGGALGEAGALARRREDDEAIGHGLPQ